MTFIPEIIFALMITVGVSMIVYDVIKGRTASALRGSYHVGSAFGTGIAISGGMTHNAKQGESR